jgi:hypothetical protein
MTYEYSDSTRKAGEHALPDIEVFQLTAEEVAELIDEDTAQSYLKRFPLAHMNSRDRQAMIDAIVEGECLTGGWFYWYCFPGCMPDSEPCGPFDSYAAALEDARDSYSL